MSGTTNIQNDYTLPSLDELASYASSFKNASAEIVKNAFNTLGQTYDRFDFCEFYQGAKQWTLSQGNKVGESLEKIPESIKSYVMDKIPADTVETVKITVVEPLKKAMTQNKEAIGIAGSGLGGYVASGATISLLRGTPNKTRNVAKLIFSAVTVGLAMTSAEANEAQKTAVTVAVLTGALLKALNAAVAAPDVNRPIAFNSIEIR